MSENPAEQVFHRLHDKPCWNAKSGYGGFPTMEFGKPARRKPYDETSDQWLLYGHSGYVFSLRGDGCYSHNLGDTLPDEVRYKSLE